MIPKNSTGPGTKADSNQPFPCTRCGACCRLIGRTIGYFRLHARKDLWGPGLAFYDFPYEITPSGACAKYDPAIGCTVYDHRPEVCNFSSFHRKYLSSFTLQQFHRMIATECNQQMDELDIDPAFRVNLVTKRIQS